MVQQITVKNLYQDYIEYWPELDVSEKYSLRISQLVDWDRF